MIYELLRLNNLINDNIIIELLIYIEQIEKVNHIMEGQNARNAKFRR